MTIPHYGALLKLLTWGLGLGAAIIFAMDPTVKVAIIVSVPPTLTSLLGWWAAHKKLQAVGEKVSVVETQTNNMNTELRQQRNAATTRADSAEGQMKGVAAEQERTKDKP